jgi:hypothetical protein
MSLAAKATMLGGIRNLIGSGRLPAFLSAVGALILVGCVQASPPKDTGGGLTLSSPDGHPILLSYVTDLQPVFATDCVPCHNASSPAGGYSMSDYASVMTRVRPGDAKSPLVLQTQPPGAMFGFFSGDRMMKSSLVYTWVVEYDGQELAPGD